jgi:hypothetical protein
VKVKNNIPLDKVIIDTTIAYDYAILILFYLNYLFIFIHLFTCAYIVLVVFPSCVPFPPSPSYPSCLPGTTCSALFSNFVEDISNNETDKALLLVQVRIDILRDS